MQVDLKLILILVLIIVIVVLLLRSSDTNKPGGENEEVPILQDDEYVSLFEQKPRGIPEKLSVRMQVADIQDNDIEDFHQLVPHKIHQIWLGSREPPTQTQMWQALADKYGYEYKIWREEDLTWLQNMNQFEDMIERGSYQGAADVARYEIINRHGGLYVDADFKPQDIPIFKYLPREGLGLSPEHIPKRIVLDTGSVFYANGFIVSSPNHPVIKRVIASLPLNHAEFADFGFVDAQLATGPFLLTACLHGLYTGIDVRWVMTDKNNDGFHIVELND